MKLIFSSLLFFSGIPSTAVAQITPDSSLGTENSVVENNGNRDTINGGAIRDANLFHSFQEFNVGAGKEAYFTNPNGIANIFSRVTGNNFSNIQGTLGVLGNANLFLINPNGILFGENARLDVNGSFFATSADSVVFGNGFEFSAANPNQPPLLTIDIPIGLKFRDNPGDITNNQGTLSVNSEATIGLLGGNLVFEDGGIENPGGRVELGSVTEGEVNLIEVANGFTVDYSAVENFGDISLSGRSVISASGEGGGDIQVAGKDISITGLSGFVSNTSGANPGGDINILATDSLAISGIENDDNFVSAISNRVLSSATADGGDINIETGNLRLGDRALIDTFVSGQGNAGNINIKARETASLESQGNTSAIISRIGSGATGNGGDINITTSSLNLSNGASLNASTSGQGDAGNIELNASSITFDNGTRLDTRNFGQRKGGDVIINATNDVSFANNSDIFVTGGEGGSININAKNLSITSGSIFFGGVDIDLGFSEAQSGDIVINLTEDLLIDGLDGERLTFITNTIFGEGNPGNIDISARNITFQNGGNISILIDINKEQEKVKIGNIDLNATGNIIFDGNNNSFNSGILNFLPKNTSGNIGEINVTAQNLTLTNGAQIQSLVGGVADSGDININVADSIKVDGFAEISTRNRTGILSSNISSIITEDGKGNAGTININTSYLYLSRNGSIFADIQGEGNAGGININANQITIGGQGNTRLLPSYIRADTFGNEGNGGNILINTGSLRIKDGGSVSASVLNGFGTGGNITINARDIISVEGEGILFSSEEQRNIEYSSQIDSGLFRGVGNGGNIQINTAKLILNNDALISANIVESKGNGGEININATNSIEVLGESDIEADVLPGSTGNSGNLTIETGKLLVTEGSQISVSTFGNGNAGNLTIRANDSIKLSGIGVGRSGLFASALEEDGNGNNLTIFTQDLIIRDGATISVGNFPSIEGLTEPGTGEAGNLIIEASNITLENGGRITAATQSPTGEGANIILNVSEDITLRDNSFISAQALKKATGGNLDIDARFTIAFPSQNNDIIANAEDGQGGNIDITAEALFGIKEREANLGNETNDIDASSQFGLDGNISVNTLTIDPTSALLALTQEVVDPAKLIAQNVCTQTANSSFVNKISNNILRSIFGILS